MSSFKAFYVYPAFLHIPYFPKDSLTTEVNTMLYVRMETIQIL